MIDKKYLSGILVVAALTASASASASTISFGGTAVAGKGIFSSVAGATTVDFESGEPTRYTGGAVEIGNVSGQWAAPTNDATHYLATGIGSVTIDLASAGASYFGMYWGSLDSYNTITLFNGSSSESYTGSQIALRADTSGYGTESRYVNFLADKGASYSKIVLSSTHENFETDNHAFLFRAAGPQAPEPSTTLLLGGGGLLLAVCTRKRLFI